MPASAPPPAPGNRPGQAQAPQAPGALAPQTAPGRPVPGSTGRTGPGRHTPPSPGSRPAPATAPHDPATQAGGHAMTARIINGRAYAADLRRRVAAEVDDLAAAGARPGLATVLVGDDYAARAYEGRLRAIAGMLGCRYVHEALPQDAEEADALAAVGKLNADPRISGILILRPLPPQVSELAMYAILDPLKDVEAVHPANAGLLSLGRPRFVPSTPGSCFYLLDSYLEASGRDPGAFYQGRTAVFVGRSNNVGKPAMLLALARNLTAISCDEHTFAAGRLAEYTAQGDVLVVAAGVAGLISGDMVREGAIVIDVGINPVKDPGSGRVRLVGDVDAQSVAPKAEALSPVPGGVGPVTDAWLVHNTVLAARMAAGLDAPASPLPPRKPRLRP